MRAITGLCIRYAALMAGITFIVSIPFAGIGCILTGICGLFAGTTLMMPVVILFGFIDEKIWRLPYSDEAVLAVISLIVMLPSLVISRTFVDKDFSQDWMLVVAGLVAVVAVLSGRKSLIRTRTQFLEEYEVRKKSVSVPSYPKF